MQTISTVSLRNFRGFAKLGDLRLAPLTFLVGPNSSGKSSIADAILFMVQSGLLSLSATNPIWIGPLVDLGSFEDTVFGHDTDREIEISVRVDGIELRHDHKSSPVSVEISAGMKTAKIAPEGRVKQLTVSEPGTSRRAELRRRRGRYESFQAHSGKRSIPFDASRPWIGPAEVLAEALYGKDLRHHAPTPLAEVLLRRRLDHLAATTQRVASGRDAPERSYTRVGSEAERSRRRLDGIDATILESGPRTDRRLRDALVKGLRSLGIATEMTAERLSNYHTALHIKDNVTGIISNIADVGYGASQVIPVLEGCSSPGPGPLFVEQPEIHLHPRGQGELAQVLCEASLRRQMIVETHSEHMINRARLLIVEGVLKPEGVLIQFIDRDKKGSKAIEIGLDRSGDFTRDWPNGFFDERFKETMKIAEAKAERHS